LNEGTPVTNFKRYIGWLLGVAALVGAFAVIGIAANYARADSATKQIREHVNTVPAIDWRDCKSGCVMMKAAISPSSIAA
jgi:hypothetical protein